jgi:hypothetical protein
VQQLHVHYSDAHDESLVFAERRLTDLALDPKRRLMRHLFDTSTSHRLKNSTFSINLRSACFIANIDM